jgi:hypothetical protein
MLGMFWDDLGDGFWDVLGMVLGMLGESFRGIFGKHIF